ncbi:ergothioneine biosynthesis glutamate--cysteine ligase EgtA, partial [Mycobacterium tuberculosis]|uniref:glutamate-cysteine ligase family protein n=1 Tax=Mycobacterium tuberculosis TaxID=1773 RepID=UPI000E367D1D
SGVPGAALLPSPAALPVPLAAGPPAGWAARVRLAPALGPTLLALAAPSPLLGGRFSGWPSPRPRVWGPLASARC